MCLFAACGNQTPHAANNETDARDVTKWKPSIAVSPATISSDERIRSREAQVRQVVDSANLTDYDLATMPAQIREVNSYEANEVWAQCLRDKGFEADPTGDFIQTKEIVDDQQDSYFRARADCVAMYPQSAQTLARWGEDQWRIQYEYFTDYYIPCIESFGVETDKADFPSKESFVQAGLNDDDATPAFLSWMSDPAYADLANATTEEGATLANVCRQSAPDSALYGGN